MIPYFVISNFQLGIFSVKVWGLFVAIGILLATVLAVWRSRKTILPQTFIYDLAFWSTAAALVGGRLVFLLSHNVSLSSFFDLKDGGFSSLGALIIAGVVGIVFIKLRNLPVLLVLDVIGPPLLLAEAMGRIGCFLLHEHLGAKTNFFLAVNIFGEKRHDLAIYFFAFALVGWFILSSFGNLKFGTGIIGCLSIAWYFTSRLFIEFLAEGSGQFAVQRFYGLTLIQYFSLVMLAVFVGILIHKLLIRLTKTKGIAVST